MPSKQLPERLDLASLQWHMASADTEGSGLQFATAEGVDGSRIFILRRAADPQGDVLVYTEAEWDAFLDGAKRGEFDDYVDGVS